MLPELHLCSVWYGAEGSRYHRMARVLEYTAKRHHNPERVHVLHRPDECADRSAAFRCKARDWTTLLTHGTPLGTVIGLLDADTFFQRSVESIVKHDFDLAVTRHKGRLNSGVLFARPSDRVSAFFAQWPALTNAWCDKNTSSAIRYGDQDALERMLRTTHGLKVLDLPMREWNSTQRTWHINLDKARVVHFKSGARAHVFDGTPSNALSLDVANRWKAIERNL